MGWSFTLRCRARDFSPAIEMAWSTGVRCRTELDKTVELVLRHDDGTQFTAKHYHATADDHLLARR